MLVKYFKVGIKLMDFQYFKDYINSLFMLRPKSWMQTLFSLMKTQNRSYDTQIYTLLEGCKYSRGTKS